MPTLHITDDSGKECLRVTIKDIEPAIATVAILKALEAIPAPKKPRSDRGIQRGPRVLPPAASLQPDAA